MADAVILYDSDCGFCIWSVATVLSWDRRRRLRPVPLQDDEADELLPGMSIDRRMASWHLVTTDGRVYSSGSAFAPLLRLLPGGAPLAALAAAFPRLVERGYSMAARNRDKLGKLTRARVGRARTRVEERTARG